MPLNKTRCKAYYDVWWWLGIRSHFVLIIARVARIVCVTSATAFVTRPVSHSFPRNRVQCHHCGMVSNYVGCACECMCALDVRTPIRCAACETERHCNNRQLKYTKHMMCGDDRTPNNNTPDHYMRADAANCRRFALVCLFFFHLRFIMCDYAKQRERTRAFVYAK